VFLSSVWVKIIRQGYTLRIDIKKCHSREGGNPDITCQPVAWAIYCSYGNCRITKNFEKKYLNFYFMLFMSFMVNKHLDVPKIIISLLRPGQ